MNKRFFIYEILGWPDGPLALVTVGVPGMKGTYHVDPLRGYASIEAAEEQLMAQEKDGKLQGEYVVLPVYRLKINKE